VKGSIAKRVKERIADLAVINPDLAKHAGAIFAFEEAEMRNLTAAMAACRGNDACEEVVGEKQYLVKRKVYLFARF
jgi:hypothetical protein